MPGKFIWLLAVAFFAVVSARIIPEEDLRDLEPLAEEFFSVEPQIFESKILEAIRKLRDFLKNGDASQGIPPFDPFFLPHQSFDFIIEKTQLEGSFDQVTFANFTNFEVQNVEFKLLPLHFKIEILFKEFVINGRYKMAGSIFGEIPVNGTGKFISTTQDLSLLLYVKPVKVNSSLQIKDLIFEFKTLGEKVNYTNEYESNEYQMLDEDFVLDVLNQVQTRYVPAILEMGKLVLNHFLLGYTSQDIIKIILDFLKKNVYSNYLM